MRSNNELLEDLKDALILLVFTILVIFATALIAIIFKGLKDYFVFKQEPPHECEKEIVYVYILQEPIKEEPFEKPVEKKEKPPKATRGGGREFIITAYDNSVESQEQWVDQTATGFNLKGHTLETAKCIAVDPKVIPLGSEVELEFDEEYEHLDGVYIARDTGGAIKGNKIDLFMGDGVDKNILKKFGKRKVTVKIIE